MQGRKVCAGLAFYSVKLACPNVEAAGEGLIFARLSGNHKISML